MTQIRRRLLVVALLAAGCVAALVTIDLPGPDLPLSGWADAEAWYEGVGPGVATVAVLRWTSVLAGGWLLVAATLQLAATAAIGPGLRRLADAVSPRVVRAIAHGTLHLSVAGVLATPLPSAASATDPPGQAVMEVLAEEPTPTTTVAPVEPSPSPSHVEPVDPDPGQVEVVAGDSFWRIAAEIVAEEGGPASEQDVVQYWRRLIQANTDRLVDPSNPDLLLPGQRLVLPRPG